MGIGEKAGAVQAVLNGSPMSAAQGTTVHERLLHPHLGHCSLAAPVVCWLPSAACAATPSFDVPSPGLFCGRPDGLELVRLVVCMFIFIADFLPLLLTYSPFVVAKFLVGSQVLTQFMCSQ